MSEHTGITVEERPKEQSILDLLLSPELPNLAEERPVKQYEVTRLSKLAGAPVVFTLRGLPYGRVQELSRLTEDSALQILLAGCTEPDLKSAALRERFGGITPAETVKHMLLPGEIEDLSRAVERLCGYRMNTIEEVKNA